MVDLFWILLNGGGVGAKSISGCLNGFSKPIANIDVINTVRTGKGGSPNNVETFDEETKVWTIKIGDSGEAWAKSVGKLLAGKYPAEKLVLDFSEIRPYGSVLSRYGWVSSGDTVISKEYLKICQILSSKADQLLSTSDINDIINHLGVIQTGRRGAEILMMDSTHSDIDEFIDFKANALKTNAFHRFQSNNSVMYWQKPERSELEHIFEKMVSNGGGDPGFINGEATRKDCPWFKVFNPCVAGDTVILTRSGNERIENLVGLDTEVWNGDEWSHVKPYSTGINEIVRVSFSDGTKVECTPYHRWPTFEELDQSGEMKLVETKDLTEGMRLKKHQSSDPTQNTQFVLIADIEYLGVEQKTYCMTEEKNNMFVANGILTGNCVEATLANRGLCNLMEINLKRVESQDDFENTCYLVGRANYRQTLVDLQDGILQDQWHQNNQFIRLCGVSLTGGFSRQDITEEQFRSARDQAIKGANDQADELGLAKAKAVTLGKPGGTVPKVMNVESGNNAPKGKYIFNRITFGKDSSEAKVLRESGYEVVPHPTEEVNVLVTFPVKYDIDDSMFKMKNGCLVPNESAVDQLNRYKKLMVSWTQQNTSNTIEYEPEEVPEIIDWLLENWDIYKGVAFMFKNDYTRTAEECGFAYLPEQVVKQSEYEEYVSKLTPINWDEFSGATNDLNSLSDGCEGGMCPVR